MKNLWGEHGHPKLQCLRQWTLLSYNITGAALSRVKTAQFLFLGYMFRQQWSLSIPSTDTDPKLQQSQHNYTYETCRESEPLLSKNSHLSMDKSILSDMKNIQFSFFIKCKKTSCETLDMVHFR